MGSEQQDTAIDVGALLLDHLDMWWAGYRLAIDDLTDAEHLWSPVDGWTVREVDGRWVIDDIPDRSVEPAPFTSIAWRMWHIAVDCLDSYSRRAFGSQPGPDDMEWYGTAAEALGRTDASWRHFRDRLGALDAAGWAAPLGELFGPFGERPRAALALHAHAEVTHHAAEVRLLRDLYRERGG